MAQGGPGGWGQEGKRLCCWCLPQSGGPWPLQAPSRAGWWSGRVGLHSHPGRWLPDLAGLGAALCPHNPLLDKVETDPYAHGLTCCCCPVQTRPGRNQWLLPLGCGLGLRLPHACSRPSGGPQMASNSEWSPQDVVARTGGLAVRPNPGHSETFWWAWGSRAV